MTPIQKPRKLKPGDCLAIVSPSSPIDRARLDPGLAVLQEIGFRTKIYPHVLDQHGFLAGKDEDRARDLQDAFDDPECAGVFCSRGGYGCARLLPYLDIPRIVESRKMFAGYSDITTLHTALNRQGLATLHAPMAITLGVPRPDWVQRSLFSALTGAGPIPADAPRGETLVAGTAEGTVTGGCLVLLCDSVGTPNPADFRNRVVLIEDVDENPHRVDAMLTHLILAGILQEAAGIVVGEMTRTDEKGDEHTQLWREIVTERIKPLGIPTIINFPFGHMEHMLSLPLGIRAKLDAAKGTLTYQESLCSDD